MQEILGTFIAGEQVVIQDVFVLTGQWEFGRAIGSAIHPVQVLGKGCELFQQLGAMQRVRTLRIPAVQRIQLLLNLARVIMGLVRLLPIHLRQLLDDLLPLLFWEVGSRINRLPVGKTNGVQGPTPAACHQLTCIHINHVDVGSFLPIHLNTNQMVIHNFGGFEVFKTLVLHHMTPMAGAVANAHQNQFIFCLGPLPGEVAPFLPSHRIVGVLKQVRAAGVNECVGFVLQ